MKLAILIALVEIYSITRGRCTSSFESSAIAQTNNVSNEYNDTAGRLLIERSKKASEALASGNFIPAESFSNAAVAIDGASVTPAGHVDFSSCRYDFVFGFLHDIHRRDLFEDKGPQSLILRHLTNDVLTLKPEAAADRALAVLKVLSFDVERIRRTYTIHVKDDLMDAYPVRDAGPNFPQELRFFGELISRNKIRITVEFNPIEKKLFENSRFGGDMQIEFLATTGELLSARVTDPEALAKLEISAPERITVNSTVDFTPPSYFSVSHKLDAAGTVSTNQAAALLTSAWNDLQRKIGTNKPHCYLLCDNLNIPDTLSHQMSQLTSGTKWAGISHIWRDDLPFEPTEMDRLAREHRGLSLLAVCGNIQANFGTLSHLEMIPVPGNDEASKKSLAAARDRLSPRIDEVITRLDLPATMPDHALFLLQPGADFTSRIVWDELQSRLRGRGEVFDFLGGAAYKLVGRGVTYLDGKASTNTLLIFSISGFLPLRMDTASLLRLQAPQRLISWEVSNPVSELAYSFGPHPLQELFDDFGPDGVRLLQEADRVEVFRIKSNTPDDMSVRGRTNIDGYEIIRRGKTQGRAFEQQLAATILNENSAFGFEKMCIWSPGIAFRGWRGKESATVIACFECHDIVIIFQNEAGKETHRVGFDFGHNSEALLQLARKAFPSDKAFQKVSEPR